MKKKVLSLLLALVLCVGLAATALAAETMKHSIWVGEILEITNVVSTETKTVPVDPDVPELGNRTITTYYTVAPTTVTLLIESDIPESDINKITEEERANDYISEWVYLPLTVGEKGQPGSSYTLDEGTYYWMTTSDFSGIYIVVSGSDTPAPDAPSTWAAPFVKTAIDTGLVPDALQSKYTDVATRAEFCALAVALYETVKGTEITERAQFSDTTDVNVEKMAGLKVVNGVGGDKFAPDQKLTREQAATMLARLAEAVGKPLAEQAPTFNDNAAISSWAYDAVGQMQAAGIMGGVGENTFSPTVDYSREQSITTILRLYDAVK